jgi:hypothetical protein
MQIADVTHRFSGFTFVRLFRLMVDAVTGEYSLQLELSDTEHDTAHRVIASFQDVSDLSLRSFGGGWTQFLYLGIEECSVNQWDRVRFRVRDLENEAVSFSCKHIVIADG